MAAATPRKRGPNPRSGTRSNLRPVQPPEFEDFDALLAEAQEGVTPYKLRVSEDEVLVIECPTSDDMDLLAAAERTRDTVAMSEAVFGEHADRIRELTGGKPFMVLGRLVERVMMHYGLQGENLPE